MPTATMSPVGTKERPADRGRALGLEATRRLCAEIRIARMDRGLSLEEVGAVVGLSAAQVSRIERNRVRDVSVVMLFCLAEVVGLEASLRAFPGGRPVRDVAHGELLADFRAEIHVSVRFGLEVPMPEPGDRRAWDGFLRGPGWRFGVEAETAPRDGQALARRLQLKQRDGQVDGVILLLRATAQTRRFVRAYGDLLADVFPVPGAVALERLRSGESPGGNAIVVVARRSRLRSAGGLASDASKR